MMTSPIHRVLFTLSSHHVRCLLIGGQACILYGAAEFSRDADITLLASGANLKRLQDALAELQAEVIAVPPFALEYLERGHAVHFRCSHPDAAGIRVDVIAKMRNVAPFEALWARRATVAVGPGEAYDVIGLADLVQSKKTQRDKDWPMIRRLIEANYYEHRSAPDEEHERFWLLEGRTPELLLEIAAGSPQLARALSAERSLLAHAVSGDGEELERALGEEEQREREADRLYWKPLREELERLRHLQ